MLLTRKRVAGVVLALALAGALSTGVASGVERLRGKTRKRLAPPAHQEAVARTRVTGDTAVVRTPVLAGLAPSPMQGGVSARRALSAPPASGHRAARTEEARGHGHAPWTSRGASSSAEDARPADDAPTLDAAGHAHATGPGAGLTARLPSPLRVSWTVVASSPGQVWLVAEVERRAGFEAPVEVRLSLPAGATLTEGAAAFTVPAGVGTGARSVTYGVAFEAGTPPSEDLVLVAHAEGASFGVHAEARHRFGRTLALEPQPMPTGPELPAVLMTADGTPSGSTDEEP
ncbi:hypothetical protein HUW63_09155 [Myxococcus sp. AM001]|nr:hypothetical protein [Myxococcus sp. AM001]